MGKKCASTNGSVAVVRRASVILLLIGAATVAAYSSAGELQGRVTEVRKYGDMTVFRMEIASQGIYSNDQQSANPVQLVYSGERKENIEAGQRLHIWFNGRLNDDCNPCGLNVTRIDFPNGTSVFHSEPQTQVAVGDQAWWVEPMRSVTGLITFLLATVGLYRYVIKGKMV